MKLSGIHFLLSYCCTYECDHCFVWSSPKASGTMTLAQIKALSAAYGRPEFAAERIPTLVELTGRAHYPRSTDPELVKKELRERIERQEQRLRTSPAIESLAQYLEAVENQMKLATSAIKNTKAEVARFQTIG